MLHLVGFSLSLSLHTLPTMQGHRNLKQLLAFLGKGKKNNFKILVLLFNTVPLPIQTLVISFHNRANEVSKTFSVFREVICAEFIRETFRSHLAKKNFALFDGVVCDRVPEPAAGVKIVL